MDIHKNARTTPYGRMLMVQRLASGWHVEAVATAHGGLVDELDKGEFRGAIDANIQIQFTFRRLHFGDVDVEEANRASGRCRGVAGCDAEMNVMCGIVPCKA